MPRQKKGAEHSEQAEHAEHVETDPPNDQLNENAANNPDMNSADNNPDNPDGSSSEIPDTPDETPKFHTSKDISQARGDMGSKKQEGVDVIVILGKCQSLSLHLSFKLIYVIDRFKDFLTNRADCWPC